MKLIQTLENCYDLVSCINKSGSFFSAPTWINAKYPNLSLVASAIQPKHTGTSKNYENLQIRQQQRIELKNALSFMYGKILDENLLQKTMLVKKIGFFNQKRKESGWENNF